MGRDSDEVPVNEACVAIETKGARVPPWAQRCRLAGGQSSGGQRRRVGTQQNHDGEGPPPPSVT